MTIGESNKKKVVTLGEILVEIMAQERGQGFRAPVRLLGPFPSGAPAIFIDQVAKLGQPCGIISAVGEDDFGWVNLDRLQHDGVDVSAVQVLADQATGSAFVRYRETGERDFVFNIKNSACGKTAVTEAAARLLSEAGHFHISGASLISEEVIGAARKAVEVVKNNGGTVSFDPNVRKEVMRDHAVLAALKSMLANCDIFLPSGEELVLLTEADEPAEAVEELLGKGVSEIVQKRGAAGAAFFGRDRRLDSAAFDVGEIDPTGAGDCFGATYITCRLQGRSVEESLAYANAAGAHAVTVQGPMEGTSSFAELDEMRARLSGGGGGGGGGSGGGGGLAAPVAQVARVARVAQVAHVAHVAGPSRLAAWLRRAAPERAPAGITSVCSAHPLVLEAAMLEAASRDLPVLIEATCNQVNHQGGYTGLTPMDFKELVHKIAALAHFPRERILLGGDHLGPSPWRSLPAAEALAQADLMVNAYARAGFEKVHLDASMGCLGEDEYVPAEVAAERAARLAVIAERSGGPSQDERRYVIGTEVPTPGGAKEEIEALQVTSPGAVLATLEAHRVAFEAAGAGAAFGAVMAIVAQPGVEFDDQKVVLYDAGKATELRQAVDRMPGLVFEAHSTDYQPLAQLAALVRDHFGILKVGPGLTFAMREALYGLDSIASALDGAWSERSLMAQMERLMVDKPKYWQAYYHGSPERQHWLRHFSYSDRARYYWAQPEAERAVGELFANLEGKVLPEPLVSQFLPTLYPRIVGGALPAQPREIVLTAVRDVLAMYADACG